MRLAKPHLDLGMMCSDIDASRAFYEGVLKLPYEELLKIGGGMHQHRLGLRGGVLKLNTVRGSLPEDEPTCLRGLDVVDPTVVAPVELAGPDGLRVRLVPPGFESVESIRVVWASSDPERLGRLLASGLDARRTGNASWSVGSTMLTVVHDPTARHGIQRAVGFRYLTVQVFDVFGEHERLLSLGWSEGAAPIRLGDVAAISFVRDPDGVWLEISQRASLTGALPTMPI